MNDIAPIRESSRYSRVLQQATAQFDYQTVPASVRSDLQARLIKDLIVKTTAGLIEVGRHLIAVKDHLEHGVFVSWVEAEIGIGGRTAQRYMAVARLAEAKSDSVSLLPPTIAYRLAAPSAPVEVVDYVIAQVDDGEIVQDFAVAEMIRKANEQRRETRKKERAAFRRSKAGREKQERERQRHRDAVEENRRKQESLSKAAADLIEELGQPSATRLVGAMTELGAYELYWELKKKVDEPLGSESKQFDDGLAITEGLRRDAKAGAA